MSERDHDLWRLSFGLRVVTLQHERQNGRYEATDVELDAHAAQLADKDVDHRRWRMAFERARATASAEGLQLPPATEANIAADADACMRVAPLSDGHGDCLIAYVAGIWFVRIWDRQSASLDNIEAINGAAHALARLTVEAYVELRGGS